MADPHAPARKAVLFCQHCGHASPPGGDWTIADERFVCPRCGSVVTDRTVPGWLPA